MKIKLDIIYNEKEPICDVYREQDLPAKVALGAKVRADIFVIADKSVSGEFGLRAWFENSKNQIRGERIHYFTLDKTAWTLGGTERLIQTDVSGTWSLHARLSDTFLHHPLIDSMDWDNVLEVSVQPVIAVIDKLRVNGASYTTLPIPISSIPATIEFDISLPKEQ